MNIKIYESAAEATAQLADIIFTKIEENKRINIGVATGRTMDAVYYRFVTKAKQERLNYFETTFFALDEYIGLVPQDANSFENYLDLHLYAPLGIHLENRYIPDTHQLDLEASCTWYESCIKSKGGIDLQLLGIGINGHIGFNEPGSAIDSRTRVVALSSSSKKANAPMFKNKEVPNTAITMGIGTILEAKECILIASGISKAQIIQKMINGDVHSHIPATALKTHKNCTIILDREAASLI